MKVDNVKSQMRKGMLEYCIMLLLHKEPAYASDIIQKLKEAQLIVVEGTLYPLLTRLKNDDLLSYEWVESTQGPPRKYYKLTEKGETFLGELELSWKELTETVNHIEMPVYAVCYRKSTMRQLALSYGVHAIYCEPSVSREGFLLNILYYLEDRKWLSKEDLIVVLGGSFGAATGASFLEIGNVLNLEHKALSQHNALRKD